jgi:hypothetical protein
VRNWATDAPLLWRIPCANANRLHSHREQPINNNPKIQEIIRTYYAVFDAKTGNPSKLDAIFSTTLKNYSSDTV